MIGSLAGPFHGRKLKVNLLWILPENRSGASCRENKHIASLLARAEIWCFRYLCTEMRGSQLCSREYQLDMMFMVPFTIFMTFTILDCGAHAQGQQLLPATSVVLS